MVGQPLSKTAIAALRQLSGQISTLQQAAESLASAPDTTHLSAAQEAWKASYRLFNLDLVWLLGNKTTLPLIAHRIDPLPIQPGYLDALKQWPDSGLVNDPTISLSEKALAQQNQATDNTEVSLGFQAIQFLLWGSTDLPRKAADFQFKRRAHYLTLATTLLFNDIQAAIGQVEQTGSDKTLAQSEVQQRLATIKAAANNQNAWLSPLSTGIAEKALNESRQGQTH
jgi:uncharacterized iron-regulated protein